MIDNYFGFYDEELATELFEYGQKTNTPEVLREEMCNSSMFMLEFPDNFLYELWGIINDHKKSFWLQNSKEILMRIIMEKNNNIKKP